MYCISHVTLRHCLLILVVYIIALCSSINTTTFFSLDVRCCPVLDLTQGFLPKSNKSSLDGLASSPTWASLVLLRRHSSSTTSSSISVAEKCSLHYVRAVSLALAKLTLIQWITYKYEYSTQDSDCGGGLLHPRVSKSRA
jgi:hypothetical protein